MRFEYIIRELRSRPTERWINEYAQRGWRLVTIDRHRAIDVYDCYFERPKEKDDVVIPHKN